MYRFTFVSTVRDLLDAEKAERRRLLHPWLQGAIIILGIGWIVAAATALATSTRLQYVLWMLFGTAIVLFFAVRPIGNRRRIRRTNAAAREVQIEFSMDGISLTIQGAGNFVRSWNELQAAEPAKNGILFYFDDGVKNWLPNRVFQDMGERDNLLQFIDARKVNEAEAT